MERNSELKELALGAAESAGRAAKYYGFVSKQKLHILREQERIRTLYAKLGKICYKDHVLDEEPDEAEYLPLFAEITRAYRRINVLRDSLEQAKDEYHGSPEELEQEE